MSFETFISILTFMADHPYVVLAMFVLVIVALCSLALRLFMPLINKLLGLEVTYFKWPKECEIWESKKLGKYIMRYTTLESNVNKYNELKEIFNKCG